MKKLLMALPLLILAMGCELNVFDCEDDDRPASPRGLYSITGDECVYLYWYPNTEPDLAGYRVYRSTHSTGTYLEIGVVSSPSFVDHNVVNGVTYYYSVTAFDHDGNESEPCPDIAYDTPRPAGYNCILWNYHQFPDEAGFDFSMTSVQHYALNNTDIYFEYDSYYDLYVMYVADGTDIQDFGYTESLDEVGWAPTQGWSSMGWVELILGHTYIVWTRTNHFAKFRVTGFGSSSVVFDWAYQVDPGNQELWEEGSGPPRQAEHSVSEVDSEPVKGGDEND